MVAIGPVLQSSPVAAAARAVPASAHRAASTSSTCPGLTPTRQAATPPLLVAVGASFTAGEGAGSPTDAWPYVLGRILGWRVVAKGVPGAGYVNPGHRGRGPLAREVANLDLSRLGPSLIIVQAGHDDIGAPLALVSQRVDALLGTIRRQAPRARIVLLTVFSRRLEAGPARVAVPARATDSAIITAARRVDPRVSVFDPLAGHWRFPTMRDHLHPTPAGHLWIAEEVARRLCAAGERPSTALRASGTRTTRGRTTGARSVPSRS